MHFEKPKSSIDRIVGAASPEDEEALFKKAAEVFDSQIFKSLQGKEREKTEVDLQIIAQANEVTNALLREYGGKDFDVPPKNIHIIPEEKWIRDPHLEGCYSAGLQSVLIKDRSPSRLFSLAVITHEMLHMKSHNAVQIKVRENVSDDPRIGVYRAGLEVHSRDGARMYFTELDEAITEELTRNILMKSMDRLRQDPLFSGEIQNTIAIMEKYPKEKAKSGKPLFHGDTLYAEASVPRNLEKMMRYLVGVGSPRLKTEALAYSRQRRMLSSLIDKVWIGHKDTFKDREEVFAVFVRAYLTGNLLPMGKLIEDTFGKGSLRKIVELDMGGKPKNEKAKQ